jgi:hypothetical protein
MKCVDIAARPSIAVPFDGGNSLDSRLGVPAPGGKRIHASASD